MTDTTGVAVTSNAEPCAGPRTLGPAQLMGLAGLLRAWRASAGERLGLGKPLSQEDVCSVLGRSVRWYRDLENGATPRLERSVLDGLANALQLGDDEREALRYYALGGSLSSWEKNGTIPAHQNLQMMLEQLMPRPAYLSNRHWDIVGYNDSMAAWYPWVTKPGANLMRWALTTAEARAQYADWRQHARAYLALLRFAQAKHPHDQGLTNLISDVLTDRECRSLWAEHYDVSATRDGHTFRMCIPAHGFEEVEVISHVMRPATLPDHRLVVLTWLRDGSEPAVSRLSAKLHNRSEQHRMDTSTESPTPTPVTMATEYDVQALAGSEGIPLPELSRIAGARCSLTLSPEARSVFWATEHEDGQWSVSEIAAYTTLVRLPHAVSSLQARDEYKQLVRYALPPADAEAVTRLDTLAAQHEQRAEVLREVRDGITSGGRRGRPGTARGRARHRGDEWHPVDEI